MQQPGCKKRTYFPNGQWLAKDCEKLCSRTEDGKQMYSFFFRFIFFYSFIFSKVYFFILKSVFYPAYFPQPSAFPAGNWIWLRICLPAAWQWWVRRRLRTPLTWSKCSYRWRRRVVLKQTPSVNGWHLLILSNQTAIVIWIHMSNEEDELESIRFWAKRRVWRTWLPGSSKDVKAELRSFAFCQLLAEVPAACGHRPLVFSMGRPFQMLQFCFLRLKNMFRTLSVSWNFDGWCMSTQQTDDQAQDIYPERLQ